MKDLKPIVLVEDNPHDAELALTAFEELNLAKDVLVLSDGGRRWTICIAEANARDVTTAIPPSSCSMSPCQR